MDLKTGLVCLDNQWASQANVRQRRGRAGRVKPGESYHLYTEEKYNSLEQFPTPEINRIPLTRSVLDVKVGKGNICIVKELEVCKQFDF